MDENTNYIENSTQTEQNNFQQKRQTSLAIGWIDLEFSGQSLFNRKSTPILNKINGIIKFGSLNALMGPSGCGKSTLLKCINGRNKNGLSSYTQIYLNSKCEIRSCFIVQDIKEHLLLGLTANESLIYASKLKNSGEDFEVNHQKNVNKLLSDLMVSDTKNTVIGRCSGGEQKRLAIAAELAAHRKPNLLCIDEPTSGLDSNATEIVIKCLKNVSRKHNIAIVTSIHQPNTDVLMMFDKLYVLSKGGFCVFDGHPKDLYMHMNESGIQFSEFQTPIEVLLRIATLKNNHFHQLVQKTLEMKKNLINICLAEAHLASNGIQFQSKSFSINDLWFLILRTMSYTLRSYWKAMIIQFVFIVGLGYSLAKLYNSDIGIPDGCFSLGVDSNKSCTKTVEALHEESLLSQNLKFLFFCGIIINFLIVVSTTLTFAAEVKVFFNEHQNGWYSTGSYYWAKTIVELPLNLIINICYVWLIYTQSGQLNDKLRIYAFLYLLTAGVLASQGLGFLVGILSEANERLSVILAIGLYIVYVVFCGFFIPIEELPKLLQWFSELSYPKHLFEAAMIDIYGFDRCPSGQIPSLLYQLDLIDEKKFWRNSLYLVIHVSYMRILALLALMFKANPITFHIFRTKNQAKATIQPLPQVIIY